MEYLYFLLILFVVHSPWIISLFKKEEESIIDKFLTLQREQIKEGIKQDEIQRNRIFKIESWPTQIEAKTMFINKTRF